MKKSLVLSAMSVLFSANVFATYVVVLKSGQTYRARSKWTVSGGKATVTLESGQTMQLDPSLIDEAQSEQQTRLGGQILATAPAPVPQPTSQQPSLGASIKLKSRIGGTAPAAAPVPATSASSPAPVPVAAGPVLGSDIVDKFARAYENVGLFEQKLVATGPHALRAELTADTEDKVFNAISATSFLMVRNAGVPGAQIDMVELFMKTTTGGSSGRFQMTRADAEMLDTKKISQQDYFVRRVIY